MASATSRAATGHPVSVERLSVAPCAAVAPSRERRILDATAILARVDEETERALRYDREVSVLVWSLGRGHRVDTAALARAAQKSLRSVDIIGWGGADEAIVLLPETGADASTPARRLLDAIGSLAPDARVGIGACPRDGFGADAVLAAARDAARGAPPRDLAAEVPAGSSRQDIFHRIRAASICLPALRERPRDTEVLAQRFLDDACTRLGRAPLQISRDVLDKLATHRWTGNVRELRNLMDLLAATVLDDVIDVHHVPLALASPMTTPTEAERPLMPLYDEIAALERMRIAQALRASKGVRVVAAARLGIPLRTLVTKVRVYGLGKVATRGGR